MKRTVVNLFRLEKERSQVFFKKIDNNWCEIRAELKRAEFMATMRNLPATNAARCILCDVSVKGAAVYSLVLNDKEYRWTEILMHSLEQHHSVELLVYERMHDMFADIRTIFEEKELETLKMEV